MFYFNFIIIIYYIYRHFITVYFNLFVCVIICDNNKFKRLCRQFVRDRKYNVCVCVWIYAQVNVNKNVTFIFDTLECQLDN